MSDACFCSECSGGGGEEDILIVTTFELSLRICHQEGLQTNREGLKGMGHVSFWALLIILIYWAKIKSTKKSAEDLLVSSKQVCLRVSGEKYIRKCSCLVNKINLVKITKKSVLNVAHQMCWNGTNKSKLNVSILVGRDTVTGYLVPNVLRTTWWPYLQGSIFPKPKLRARRNKEQIKFGELLLLFGTVFLSSNLPAKD